MASSCRIWYELRFMKFFNIGYISSIPAIGLRLILSVGYYENRVNETEKSQWMSRTKPNYNWHWNLHLERISTSWKTNHHRDFKDSYLKRRNSAVHHATSKPTKIHDNACQHTQRDVAIWRFSIARSQASRLLVQQSALLFIDFDGSFYRAWNRRQSSWKTFSFTWYILHQIELAVLITTITLFLDSIKNSKTRIVGQGKGETADSRDSESDGNPMGIQWESQHYIM